jgi:cobalt-zinc-cadmium resistance protein CzcA
MIDRLISFSLEQRVIVLIVVLLVVLFGAYSFMKLPIDAFPDVTNVQVQIIAKAPGMSPVEVEQLVTFPLEVEFMGLPKKMELRSVTRLGLSVITVVFEDGTDIYWCRQTVLERLIQAREKLPKGIEVALGPIATGLGEVYQYTLEMADGSKPASEEMKEANLLDFRTLQDWVVRPILRTVGGVADVNSLGGYPKQYNVLVDPNNLKKYGLTLRQIFDAIESNNANVGGGYIRHQHESYAIRGLGLLQSIKDIEEVVVSSTSGTPIYLRDVATVKLGTRYRLGGVTANGKGEAVEGLVLMLMGGNSREVVTSVKEKVDHINKSDILPNGIKITPFYNRIELVNACLSTVTTALAEGGVLIVAVLLLFLGNIRSSLIVALTLPVATLATFIVMWKIGITANLMSLGGLAIAIGMMVDGSVVIVENIYRHISEKESIREKHLHLVFEATKEVGRPMVFGILIIIIVFLPLFTLEGMEGKLFSPMAFTISIALFASLVLSLTLSPVLASFFLKRGNENDVFIMRWLKRFYMPSLKYSLTHRLKVVASAMVMLLASLLLFPFIGKEFVPVLDEGSIVINVTRLPSIALEDSLNIMTAIEREIMKFQEVKSVVSRTGTDEIGTDPMGPELSDVFITLKPQAEWRFKTKEELKEKMRETLDNIPGIAFVFSQPIQMRVDELVSGVRAQIAVKLFGEDMGVLEEKGAEIMAALKKVKGVSDLRMQQIAGQYYLEIKADRRAMARYGINVAALNEVIEMIKAGKVATEMMEGQKRFGVMVRLTDEWSRNLDSIGDLTVSAPNGARIPIKQISEIRVVEGPSSINREEGQRRIVIEANVEGRDIGSFVEDGQRLISQRVKLPTGYYITWGGQFENQQRAMKRLSIVVPLSIGLIFFLLFSTFDSMRYAALIMLNLPLALIGGIFGLWISGQYLSVPASVGFIALFGVAVLNGVVLVSYINKLREEECLTLEEAIITGCERRLRPVLMTALVAILGLVPMLLATGPGSEIQKPLATVVVGGLITSTLLTLIVLPALYKWFEEEKKKVEL